MINSGWCGATADVFLRQFPEMLENGIYESTLQQTREMRTIMEEALPVIVSLKSRCDTFANCFRGGMPDDNLPATGNMMIITTQTKISQTLLRHFQII